MTPQPTTKRLYLTKDEDPFINWIGDPEHPHTTRDMGIIKKWANFEESIRVDKFGAYVEVTFSPATPQPAAKLSSWYQKWFAGEEINELSDEEEQALLELNKIFNDFEQELRDECKMDMTEQEEWNEYIKD